MKKIFTLLSVLILAANSAYALNTDAMLQYNQGIDAYKIGQYDQAITAFRAAIDLEPNYIDAYYNLGSVLEYLGQYDAALSVFKLKRQRVTRPAAHDWKLQAANRQNHRLARGD